ncbi:MAG TPA: TlyA family RNA methyltransferase [Clostridiaceae bacterium]
MSNKKRIDLLLLEKGIFTAREQARGSIMAGDIFVDGKRVDKCGENVNIDSVIEFKGHPLPYVSRGGLKLEKAINKFQINLNNKVCFDIGASTGGFTDCMLQNGASKVFSIDVGYGQFAWKLRVDPRVVCIERKNVRYLTFEDIGEVADFASIDVSFISIKKIILPVSNLLSIGGAVVALIKPQFEAGREKVGKKGVVRDPAVHIEVINTIVDFVEKNNFNIKALDYSPIKGPEGNLEYLLYFTKDGSEEDKFDRKIIEDTVKDSHGSLS